MRTLLLSLLVGSCVSAYAATVTTMSLMGEMADLTRLANFPSPAHKSIQFSSYDRRSDVPGGQHWFANADGFGGEPIPNFEEVIRLPEGDTPGEYLMCDVSGPGAIVRMWTAQIAGDIRVYLDGSDSPLYDGPAQSFLMQPYDTFLDGAGLVQEDLEGTLYQRDAAYAPIPFAKRCRIVWIGDHRDTHFYHIQMRIYDDSAEVITFSPEDLANGADSIRDIAGALAEPDVPYPGPAREPVTISEHLEPGERSTALHIRDSGAIGRLSLRVEAEDMYAALRQTVLYIQFDGDPWGQVQSPIGDFFGAGPGINPYVSLPFTVEPDGQMTSRFLMPYEESVRIIIENRGDQSVKVTGSATPVRYFWDDATSMHFRARWRVDHDLVASNQPIMGGQDIPILLARGKGVYVGTAIMLLNPNEIPTIWGNWWGEGDEKIFVDDDVHPSIFGTGTEDYFNYSWSANDIFAYPYCGQPRNDGPANRGFIVNYRWHILDPLPFTTSLAFYMELLNHERTEGFSYGRINYYYARPGTMDDHMPLTDTDLRLPELPATWEPAPRFGANLWEIHACDALFADTSGTELHHGGMWQGGQVIVWKPAAVGESKTLLFEIKEEGDYRLHLACKLVPNGGAFQPALNGQPIRFSGRESIRLTYPHGTQSRVLSSELRELDAGIHELTITATEAGLPIGLDFLALRKH